MTREEMVDRHAVIGMRRGTAEMTCLREKGGGTASEVAEAMWNCSLAAIDWSYVGDGQRASWFDDEVADHDSQFYQASDARRAAIRAAFMRIVQDYESAWSSDAFIRVVQGA